MVKQIIKIEDFKVENVKFSVVKNNNRGGKTIFINYDYEDGEAPKKLRIQFPKMKCPFGVTGFDALAPNKEDKGKISKTSNDNLELSFKENDPNVEKFKMFENMVTELAFNNSKELLGKKYTLDFVKEFQVSNIRISADKDGNILPYPPRLRCKMTKDSEGNYTTLFYDGVGKKFSVNYENQREKIPKMSECLTIVECASIWVVNQKFGVAARPVQMKVFKNEVSLDDYAFIDEPEPSQTSSSHNETTLDSEEELIEEVEELVIEEQEEDDPLEVDVVSKPKFSRKRK
ncbi:MAG: Bathycoccus sp [Bacteroidota bacterium]